jgi:hypothetical protein
MAGQQTGAMNLPPASLSVVFDPVSPLPVLLWLAALLAAFTAYSYWKLGGSLSRWRRLVLIFWRVAGLALVFLLLLQPSREEEVIPPKLNRVTLIALDTSRSMKQTDVEKTSRFESAKSLLYNADLAPSAANLSAGDIRWFEFNGDAMPVTGTLENLKPDGVTTRMDRSINTILASLNGGEEGRALVLLTDGHDLEMVNPAKTAALARSRQMPIFAVPFGRQGKVRDVSARIANYQPYSYVKQKARINAVLRLIGCEFEDLTVQLLRQGEVVQTRHLNAEENSQLPVEFEVVEPEVGQFEYEIRVVPLQGEIDTENNSALTYLNVIDQQIQVLLLEGLPYWDTTFLQRSLMRNDKINLDCILQYSPGAARVIRKNKAKEELKIPATQDEFNQYDVIILGRDVDLMLDASRLKNLQNYVKEHGGTVIFSRGKAFYSTDNELQPVIWDSAPSDKVSVQVSREGQSVAPFKVVADQANALPDLIAGHKIQERKPLSVVLAQAVDRNSGEAMPGFVHRRFGQGQVLSVGVDGLWHWAFNPKAEPVNSMFDRFWDQMILWLMAGRDFLPNKQFSFRSSSANILLGEKVYFKLVMRNLDTKIRNVPVTIFKDDKEIARTSLTPGDAQGGYRLSADFLPEKTGRYRALADLPDGTHEESKFIVFNENLEETEVAADLSYLRRLCESSGGRVINPEELKKLKAELDAQKASAPPQIKRTTAWDRTWIFYLIGLVFGIDWYFRRKWGLC